MSSIRLLVVSRSPPESSFLWAPNIRMAAQPRAPGCRNRPLSVYKVTVFHCNLLIAHAQLLLNWPPSLSAPGFRKYFPYLSP